MILDSLDQSAQYESLHPLFPKAFAYIKSLDFSQFTFGKTHVVDDSLFVIISDSTLKPKEEVQLEAHNQYIDIQLPLSCPETFGWRCRTLLTSPIDSFDTSKDIQFFEDVPTTYLQVVPGNFVIFFPGDAHAPCIGEGSVLKIVVKVKL